MSLLYRAINAVAAGINMLPGEKYQSKAAEKKQETRDLIPEKWRLAPEFYPTDPYASVMDIPAKCGILTEKELDITENYSAKDLLLKLADGEISSVEVTTAFCKRAAIATQLLDCCTELMFDQALARAKQCDDFLAKNGHTMGPLHGLPISLKDSFHIPGFDSTIGYVSFIGNKNTFSEYANLCKVLLDLGAVFYVKTNVPQTMMVADSVNHIWGRAKAPFNLSLSAGGSSGGEGALSKFKGTVLGVGTDIAGSIRIPSSFCGVHGFKPTTYRIPYGGQQSPSTTLDGKSDATACGLMAVAGPIGRTVEDLELFFKAVISKEPWNYDVDVKCVPYDSSYEVLSPKSRLKVGVIVEDPRAPVLPNIKKSIVEAAMKLKEAGHDVVFATENPGFAEAWDICDPLFGFDNNYSVVRNIVSSGEPLIPELFFVSSPSSKLTDLVKLTRARQKFASKWSKFFIDNKFDIIMCPATNGSAPVHGGMTAPPYTVVWNACDFPALVVPRGKPLSSTDDFSGYEVTGKNDMTHSIIEWEPEKMIGGEAHIQFVARDFQDEKLLACAKILLKDLEETD